MCKGIDNLGRSDCMPSRNASFELEGWDFQINAAIFMVLKDVKNIERVRLEGKLQDIELTKNDKTKIYAQAKFVHGYDDDRNVIKNLRSALISLKESLLADPSCISIIYCTNSPNPLKKDKSFYSGITNVSYSELPEDHKEVIDDIIKKECQGDFDCSRLRIQIIPFHGDDLDNRYKVIKEAVNEFLAELGLGESGFSKLLLPIWQNQVFKNGTIPNTSVEIKKSELVWPLIFLVTDQASDAYIAEELDQDVYEDVKAKYRNLVQNSVDQFEFYTKVVGDFNDFKFEGNRREKRHNFIAEKWRDYLIKIQGEIFMLDEEQEYVIKMILYKILVKRSEIDRIKKGVGL